MEVSELTDESAQGLTSLMQNVMFMCNCHRIKCNKGLGAWNKFKEITDQYFLTNLGQYIPVKINLGFAKIWFFW